MDLKENEKKTWTVRFVEDGENREKKVRYSFITRVTNIFIAT